MSDRPPVPESVAVQVLVDNQHTCCICHTLNLHVQLHHIDENRDNNLSANLAVVCVSCHSRVTGDEGLGRRCSYAEVAEFKRRWELACAVAIRARAERAYIESFYEDRHSAEKTGIEDITPLYANPKLAATVGFTGKGGLGIAAVAELTDRLKRNGKLATKRPTTLREYEPDKLISETVVATKVIIPHCILKTTVPGVRELAVWVADPSTDSLAQANATPYEFPGCFLYLVTPLYDDAEATTFFTGCSALQVISNLATGSPFITRNFDEPLGRNNYAHPTDKLVSIGGIIIDRRPIDVLYKPRYMSDEQCFTKNEQNYRVHDLLGYPLYIANSFEAFLKRGREQHMANDRKGRKRKSAV